MIFRRSFAHVMSLAGAVALTMASFANGEEDLQSLVEQSIKLMQQENWGEALKLNAKAVASFGADPKASVNLYGAQFGAIYYRKGLCELKLGLWEDAMKSFETCYKDFPSVNEASGNPYEKLALVQWGDAAMGAGKWQQALDLYDKFLKERDKVRDAIPVSSFYINLSICHYSLGHMIEGSENLEIAINNKDKFKTSDVAILLGFRAMVATAIDAKNEQVILDFIEKNRGLLTIDPLDMCQYSAYFLKLATNAMDAGMDRTAFLLYQMAPSIDAAMDQAKFRLDAMENLSVLSVKGGSWVKADIEKMLQSLEESKNSGRSLDVMKLRAVAYLHEKYGNVRGACGAYKLLELSCPNAENREENLFNLVRASFMVDIGNEGLGYAEKFIKDFPESKHALTIRRLMLASLFYAGDYPACIERATEILPKLKSGTPEHDLCLHVLGGSYFYTGAYEKAQPLLDQHVASYPESLTAVASHYFQASNAYRLGDYPKAGPLLDEFTTKFSKEEDNVFLSYALFDRAMCHYNLSENEPALTKVNMVIEKFPTAEIIDQAYNLRGNLKEILKDLPAAQESYKDALKTAVKLEHPSIAKEALYHLVNLFVDRATSEKNPKLLKEAVVYADQFWKDGGEESSDARAMAMAQVTALESAGRMEDAMSRLKWAIVAASNDPEANLLEELIATCSDAYVSNHTPEQLKEFYSKFPDVQATARSLFCVEVMRAFEVAMGKEKDAARKHAMEAAIKALLQELKNDFKVSELTNSTLVKLGDYLRLKTATPREALPFYEEIMKRNDSRFRFRGLLGRADIYGQSLAPADMEKSLADFELVYKESQESKDREFALYRMIELLVTKKDFVAAEAKAKLFVDKDHGFPNSNYSAQVVLMLAKSYEGRGMMPEAIDMYGKAKAIDLAHFKIAVPATIKWMQLLWERNLDATKPGVFADRQEAYTGGAMYIKATEHLQEKMTDADLAMWKELEVLVKQYEASPGIKALEQPKEDKGR
jgi:tetratricopeptide (TPR) repeat protein